MVVLDESKRPAIPREYVTKWPKVGWSVVGNARSGRKPPQIDRRERLGPDDIPQRPGDLDQIGAAYWDASIATAQHLRRSDSDLAAECCRLYSLYRWAIAECEGEPLNDDAARTAGKYYDRWIVAVKLLGLDYFAAAKASREVRRDKPNDQISTEEKFFGVVG